MHIHNWEINIHKLGIMFKNMYKAMSLWADGHWVHQMGCVTATDLPFSTIDNPAVEARTANGTWHMKQLPVYFCEKKKPVVQVKFYSIDFTREPPFSITLADVRWSNFHLNKTCFIWCKMIGLCGHYWSVKLESRSFIYYYKCLFVPRESPLQAIICIPLWHASFLTRWCMHPNYGQRGLKLDNQLLFMK